MGATLVEYQLTIRNADDTADDLVVSSVAGDALPWLEGAPQGDGSEFDPLNGRSSSGAFSVRVIDGITAGTDRVLTSKLEDAGYRQQLAERVGIIRRRENAGAWSVYYRGIVTAVRLARALVYEVTISDATLAPRAGKAFAPRRDPTSSDPGRLESIADYVARWPNRGCVLGGPVRGGLAAVNSPDLGGWTMRVHKDALFGDVQHTRLEFVSGYGAPTFSPTPKGKDLAPRINDLLGARRGGLLSGDTVDRAADFQWPNMVLELVRAGVSSYWSQSGPWLWKKTNLDEFCQTGGNHPGNLFVFDAPGTTLTDGEIVRVRGFKILPCEESPIYWSGHPVDLLVALWDEGGFAYNAAAVTAAKAAIGNHRLLTIRVTDTPDRQEFIERVILGPFGLSVRGNADGELEPFATRVYGATAPTTEITAADVVADENGVPDGTTFDLSAQTAIRRVVFNLESLRSAQAAVAEQSLPPDSVPLDGIVRTATQVERINADPGAKGTKDLSFDIPGMPHVVGSAVPDLAGFCDVVAHETFDRWGRGIIAGVIVGIPGGAGDGLALGDEFLNVLPQFPNRGKRLIDDPSVTGRAVQVVRITPSDRGREIKWLDSGPNAQPFPTVPTLSISTSGGVATVVITNAATLNAAGAGVRLQMATTTGAAPAAGDATDVVVFGAGQIPTSYELPAVAPGRTVYARARSEKPGSRPSSYSAFVSAAVAGMAAPSAVTVTPSGTDGSKAVVAFTPGSADYLTDVYLYPTASGAALDRLVTVLPDGSNRYTLEGLTPGAGYTLGLVHRDPTNGAASARVTATFTAGATTVTLTAPGYETGFAGSIDPFTGFAQTDGVYGLAVVATVRPGWVEVEEAVEDAPLAGTFGAFATVGKVPVVQGSWTIWQSVAPSDGKIRRLRARHTRDGATASSYTSNVDVLPWTPLPLSAYPTQGRVRLTLLDPSPSTDADTLVRVQADYVDPTGIGGQVRVQSITSNSAVDTGLAVGTWGTSPQIWKLDRPLTGDGSGEAWFEGKGASGSDEDSLPIPEVGASTLQWRVEARLLTPSTTAPIYRVFVSHNAPGTEAVTLSITATGCSVSPTGPLAFSVPTGVSAHTDFTITVPDSGTAGAQVRFTASGGTLLTDSDAVNIADLGQDAAGTVTVTFSTGGVPTVWLNGASTQGSWRYAYSTSVMPSDAAAYAGSIVNGRTVSVTLGTTVALGGRIYLKAVPYIGAGAAGAAGQLVALEVERTDANTAKTLRIAHTQFSPEFDTDAYTMAVGELRNSGYANQNYRTALVLPTGVMITAFRARLRNDHGSGVAYADLLKIDTSAGSTTIVTVTSTPGAGIGTYSSGALSTTLDGSVYTANVKLNSSSVFSPTELGLLYVEVDYAAPSLSKSI